MNWRTCMAATLLLGAPLATHAEGFFRLDTEAVDASAWPEVSVLLRVEDESSESDLDDRTALPNPASKVDCPAGACWTFTRLEENGTPVTVLAQQSAPIQARSAEQFLWVKYRSNRPQRGSVELQAALETGYGGNRTAADQWALRLEDAAQTPLVRYSPWPYLAKHWDDKLNLEYKTVRESLSGEPQRALVEAQRAWIRYRDAFCAASGETTPDARERCVALRTAARETELRNARHLLARPRSPAN